MAEEIAGSAPEAADPSAVTLALTGASRAATLDLTPPEKSELTARQKS